MRCEHVREQLLEGTLEDRTHLQGCPSCAALERRIQQEQEALHVVLNAYEAQPVERRRHFPWLATAVVVFAIAATLGLVFYSLELDPPPQPRDPATPPIEAIPDRGDTSPTRTEEEIVQPTTRARPTPTPSPRPTPVPTSRPARRRVP